jgi:hypothetical protein
MSRRRKLTISVIFAIATIVLTSVLVYSFGSYFGVYTALRRLNVSISEFNVVEFNTTYTYIATILTLDNPAAQEFYTIGLEQNMYFNGQFFAFTRPGEPSTYRPMRIPPQSSFNVTINTDVPSSKIEMLQEATERNWFTSILVVLESPMIGRFSLRTSRQVVAS